MAAALWPSAVRDRVAHAARQRSTGAQTARTPEIQTCACVRGGVAASGRVWAGALTDWELSASPSAVFPPSD